MAVIQLFLKFDKVACLFLKFAMRHGDPPSPYGPMTIPDQGRPAYILVLRIVNSVAPPCGKHSKNIDDLIQLNIFLYSLI